MKEIVIAVISLVAGGFIGPYINWGIEKRKQKLAYRRELITQWRTMLVSVKTQLIETYRKMGNIDYADNDMGHLTFISLLERSPAYYSLKLYLNIDAIRKINKAGHLVWHRDVDYAFSELELVIAKLERKWELV